MKSIYKYPLDRRMDRPMAGPAIFKISVPRWSEILTIQLQNEVPCIWAMVDKESPAVKGGVQIEIYGTGWEIADTNGLKYIGTIQMHDMLVFHAFERLPRE